MPIVFTLPLNEYASNGSGTRTDDWPKLDFILCNEGNWSILEGDIKSIKPATVIAYDNGRFNDAVLFLWAIVFDSDCDIVHQFSIVIKIPNTSFHNFLLKFPIFETANDYSKHQSPDKEARLCQESNRQ